MFSSPVSMEASSGTVFTWPCLKVELWPTERNPTSLRKTWVTWGL